MDPSNAIAKIEFLLERTLEPTNQIFFITDIGMIMGITEVLMDLNLIEPEQYEEYIRQIRDRMSMVELGVIDVQTMDA